MKNKNAVFTIVSNNYLSHARVFANSFLKFNQNCDVYVLLVDKLVPNYSTRKDHFEIIEAAKIGIKNFNQLAFKYNILELNTAVKPFFFDYLFNKCGYKKILYFDPDILITNSLSPLFSELDSHSIIIVPHITKPLMDGKKPDEIDFLISGNYNFGFVGLKKGKETRKLINWWSERLYEYCKYDTQNGLFVDQKWANLIPSLFPDYKILYDPGYNVAYWNLHERKIKYNKDHSKIKVNGELLYFYHFSGFNFDYSEIVSKHQNRYRLKDLEQLKNLFNDYKSLLEKQDYIKIRGLKYHYGYFENGTIINQFIRNNYLKHKSRKNPFSTNGNSYYNWLLKTRKGTLIPNLAYEIYKDREDLQLRYADLFKSDNHRFLEWFVYFGSQEYDIDPIFYKNIVNTKSRVNRKSIIKNKIHIAYEHPFVQNNKHKIKNIIGPKNFYFIRNKFDKYIWSSNNGPRLELKKFPKTANFGINVSGHLTAESGTGQAARSLLDSIKTTDIPISEINFERNIYRKGDSSTRDVTTFNPYSINLVCINADQVDIFAQHVEKDFFNNKYNIGYWLWELSEFPDEWIDSFKYFDEIWTSSSFAQEAISIKSNMPVQRIPLSVNPNRAIKYTKEDFGVNNTKFLYLYMFDYLSVVERKNPIAAINAYKGISKMVPNSVLLIKTVNEKYSQIEANKIKSEAQGYNIKFIDKYLTREEVFGLLSTCDCYLSPHRSEGFGYSVFEAMYYKKPVIVTDYSGVSDYINVSNSYPVDYKIVKLDKNYGPYKKGSYWANPNIDTISKYMYEIYINKKESVIKSNKGYQTVKNELSNNKIGKIIENRINIIKNRSI